MSEIGAVEQFRLRLQQEQEARNLEAARAQEERDRVTRERRQAIAADIQQQIEAALGTPLVNELQIAAEVNYAEQVMISFVYRGREAKMEAGIPHIFNPSYIAPKLAMELGIIDKAVELRAKREQVKHNLIAAIATVQTWPAFRELLVIAEDNDLMYNDGSGRGYILIDSGGDDQDLEDAYQETHQRLMAVDQKREALRLQTQEERFRPFVYYSVEYAVKVTDDCGTVYVDTSEFDTLIGYPTAGGWWVPADHGRPMIRLGENLVAVRRYEVRTPDAMPGWCPLEQTEYGAIHIPPDNAEALK